MPGMRVEYDESELDESELESSEATGNCSRENGAARRGGKEVRGTQEATTPHSCARPWSNLLSSDLDPWSSQTDTRSDCASRARNVPSFFFWTDLSRQHKARAFQKEMRRGAGPPRRKSKRLPLPRHRRSCSTRPAGGARPLRLSSNGLTINLVFCHKRRVPVRKARCRGRALDADQGDLAQGHCPFGAEVVKWLGKRN